MLDKIRRRAGAGISLCGLFVAGDRLRPAFRLCATLPWREIGKPERQTGQRGAVIGLDRGFVAALLVSLAGCAVGPDFAPPLAPVADTSLEWRNKCNYPLPFFRAQILRNYPQILGRGFCGFRPGCRGLSGMGLRP